MSQDDASDNGKISFEEQPDSPKVLEPKVAFGDEGEIAPRDKPRGVEMRREITKEDKELAAAGYDHLQSEKNKPKASAKGELEKVDIVEHKIPLSEFNNKLNTQIDTKDPGQSRGLTQVEAEIRLARDGRNVLTPPKKKSALRKYFDCLRNLFNLLLIIAGILEYILLGIDFADNKANEYLGAILIGVAFLNAFIEFYQLQKSEAILNSFLALIPPTCRAVREGAIVSMPAANLVNGDVILLRMGDKTPADCVLFAANDLKVDNSSLTGESEPQERLPLLEGANCRPAEAENLVFNSTLIVSGEAWGVVIRTGDHTLIGIAVKFLYLFPNSQFVRPDCQINWTGIG